MKMQVVSEKSNKKILNENFDSSRFIIYLECTVAAHK